MNSSNLGCNNGNNCSNNNNSTIVSVSQMEDQEYYYEYTSNIDDEYEDEQDIVINNNNNNNNKDIKENLAKNKIYGSTKCLEKKIGGSDYDELSSDNPIVSSGNIENSVEHNLLVPNTTIFYLSNEFEQFISRISFDIEEEDDYMDKTNQEKIKYKNEMNNLWLKAQNLFNKICQIQKSLDEEKITQDHIFQEITVLRNRLNDVLMEQQRRKMVVEQKRKKKEKRVVEQILKKTKKQNKNKINSNSIIDDIVESPNSVVVHPFFIHCDLSNNQKSYVKRSNSEDIIIEENMNNTIEW